MSDEAAFLRTIIDNPDDDAPRLIFADWLEERGDVERAEFIRLQCALARMAGDSELPWNEQSVSLEARVGELLTDHNWSCWGGFLREFGIHSWQFYGGFVEKIWIGERNFYYHAPRLFKLAPIRRVAFIGNWDWDKLIASKWCRRLIGLDFNYLDRIPQQVVAALGLTRIKEISCHKIHSWRLDIAAILSSPCLGGLALLDLRNSHFNDQQAEMFRTRFGKRVLL